MSSPDRDLRISTAEDGGVEHVCDDDMAPSRDFIAGWVADRLVGSGKRRS